MNYSDLIIRKKQYKYSVNINFDIDLEDKLADFIPNLTTTEIIRDYIGSIIRGNNNMHSRILYGSYGTGKSHLMTVISSVLGHINTNKSGFEVFKQRIASYDRELAVDIESFIETEKPYFIVPIHSDFDSFNKCITFSLKKEFEKKGIRICFNGYFEEALELIEKWCQGQDSLNRLEDECKRINVEINDLKDGLATYDIKYEDVFNKVYYGMSYGAAFNSSSGNLIDNLNLANEIIKESYKGIVFIFDEFGRYVEDYGNEIKVKSIQDFAEYCDHSNNDNHLFLVSHKQLSLYTANMKKSASDEWKKIEGRFKSTSINVKYDQCLSLIGNIIPKTRKWDSFKVRYEKELNNLYNQAWDFKGFLLPPGAESENPFENGFPLHPITLFALDRLSKKVAQNERTFFTYLAGNEENSFYSQLQKLPLDEFHYVGLDSIYDYFELNIKTYKTDEAYAYYKKLQYAINKIGNIDNEYLYKVLKAIAVISIIGDTDSLTADKNTLVSVIDGNNDDIICAIDTLEKKKVIKYMRQYGYYDFFDSSIFDLEEMIKEKLSGINIETVVNILNEKFANFVMYPYSYNEEYHINRVFVPVFAKKEDVCKKAFKNSLPRYYDGVALFILDNNCGPEEYLELKDVPERSVLIVNRKSETLIEEIKRYIAIQYYYSKKDELAKDDPTVVTELELYLNEQKAIVEEQIKIWKKLERDVLIIHNQKLVDIKSEQHFSEVISNVMRGSFNKTLIVNNDLINRNTLTGAIKQARRKALDSIIGNENIYENIAFLSPEYNILRSVISKNGIDEILDSSSLNRFNDDVVSGEPVIREVKEILSSASTKHIPLSTLYKVLKKEPYGIRDGYISILMAYVLRDYENVSLYFHGTEHSYSSEELIKALQSPDDYTLYICNWTEEELQYIEALESIFGKYLAKEPYSNRLEGLFKAINSHYAAISKSARTTELYVSDLTKAYRNILNLSYKDYNAFFFDVLPQLCSNLNELSMHIANIVEEFDQVSERQYNMVLRTIKQAFEIREDEDLIKSICMLYDNNWSSKKAKAFDYTTNRVMELASVVGKYNEKQFVLELAKVVTGFELAYWTDNKINDFDEELRISLNKLNEYDYSDVLRQGETKVIIEMPDGEPIVSQFVDEELSLAGKTMLNKMTATINSFGGSITYEEKVSIIAKLFKDTIC